MKKVSSIKDSVNSEKGHLLQISSNLLTLFQLPVAYVVFIASYEISHLPVVRSRDRELIFSQ